jgi:hypothetical protein
MSKNRDFDKSIIKACDERNDSLSTAVRGRVVFANDLHAVDAVYHTLCDTAFRTKINIPKRYSCLNEDSKNVPSGRPMNTEREMAFELVVAYFRENDEEQLTVNDLVNVMKKELEGSQHEAFSVKWTKSRLLGVLEDEITITDINGMVGVVTFTMKASKILQKFYAQQKSADEQKAKDVIILTAEKLLKTEIKKIKTVSEAYPCSLDMSSSAKNAEYLPRTLQLLLDNIFVSKNSDLKVCIIVYGIHITCYLYIICIQLFIYFTYLWVF